MALTPPGTTCTLPTVATQPCASAARAGRDDHGGQAEHRRPRGRRARWCRRGWPRRARRPASGRAARCRCRRRRSGRGRRGARPCSTCSSTNVPIRRERLVVAAEGAPGRGPARRIASAIVTPSPSVSAAGPVGAERAGDDPRPGAGDAEPGALLVGEVDDADRAGRARSRCSRSWSTAARAPTTPSGPSNAPPSGTESRCEPMTTPGSPAATAASGSPHQAHWLPIRSVGEVEPARRRTRRRTTRAGRGPRGSRRTGGSRRCRRRGRGPRGRATSAGSPRRPRRAVASWTWVHWTLSLGPVGSHVPGDCLGAQTFGHRPYAGAMTASGEERATGALTASGIDVHRDPARAGGLARGGGGGPRRRAARHRQDPRGAARRGRLPLRARARRPRDLVAEAARAPGASTGCRCPTPRPRWRSPATSAARSRRSARPRAWPVVADATMTGRTVSLGAGAHGVAATVGGRRRGARARVPTSPTSPTPPDPRLIARYPPAQAPGPGASGWRISQ